MSWLMDNGLSSTLLLIVIFHNLHILYICSVPGGKKTNVQLR